MILPFRCIPLLLTSNYPFHSAVSASPSKSIGSPAKSIPGTPKPTSRSTKTMDSSVRERYEAEKKFLDEHLADEYPCVFFSCPLLPHRLSLTIFPYRFRSEGNDPTSSTP